MRTPIDDLILDTAIGLDQEEIEPLGYTVSRDAEDDMYNSVHNLTRDVAFRRRSFDPEAERQQPPHQGEIQVGTDDIRVELVQGINEDDFKRTCSMAIKGVAGFKGDDTDWEELLKGGLQTGLESQVIVFAVEGVSRACTHQLVRTRKAAFHQQSQRAMYYGAHPEVRMAESVWNNDRARKAALRAIYYSHKAYEVACEEDISYQDARLNLTEGTCNWIMLEYPLRTFIDTYAYRACSMFQWEIVTAFRKMKEVLVAAHPWIEPYVKISCEKTHGNIDKDGPYGQDDWRELAETAHTCTYQGHERVAGQCDFPWARESNRTFKSEHHSIERKESK